MGQVTWLKEVPESAHVADAAEKVIVIEEYWFEAIDDYTRSMPTSPSPGRIYRKNFGYDRDDPDDWYIYITEADPNEAGYVLHHPHKVLLVKEPVPFR